MSYIVCVWDDFQNNAFVENTSIYKYGARKIKQCNYLRDQGRNITEPCLFQSILSTLPQSWDEAVECVFSKHNPSEAMQLVELLELEERKIHPLWIELRRTMMCSNTTVRNHMRNKINIFYRLRREGLRPNMFSLRNAIVFTLPQTWPKKNLCEMLNYDTYDMIQLSKLLESVEENMSTSQETFTSSEHGGSTTPTSKSVTLNANGLPIKGKYALKARILHLLKTNIGIADASWDDVDGTKKNDLWDDISKEYNLSQDRKEDYMKAAGLQLKTFRSNLRTTYFKGLDSKGILALKDHVPEKEQIQLHDWNTFILRESTTFKMEQREKGRVSRSFKSDVHCLGRMSYAEKTEEMVLKHKRPVDRSEVYMESRRRKDGEFHPKVAEAMSKLSDLRSSQGSSSQNSLDTDALAVFKGKEIRGTTRGVGRVTKTRLKAIAPILSELARVETREQKRDLAIEQIQSNIALMLQSFRASGIKIAQPSDQLPTGFEQTFNDSPNPNVPQATTPSPPQSPGYYIPKSPIHPQAFVSPPNDAPVDILDLDCTKKIASGHIVSAAISGTIVHGHKMLGIERKVYVDSVEEGQEDHPLYRSTHGADTIKDVEKSWVVWPLVCLNYKGN